MSTTPDPEEDFVPIVGEETIKARILHTLSIYPKISRSMLQCAIGTSLPPSMWKPIFEKLVADRLVIEDKVSRRAPSGRDITYNIIQLATPENTSGL